jgi:hypothetical protein
MTTWFASMFVKDYQIRDAICSASVRELFYDVISSVYPVGVREHQAHFLREPQRQPTVDHILGLPDL